VVPRSGVAAPLESLWQGRKNVFIPETDTMSRPFVPLAEFQKITRLSDSAIVWLLSHNKLSLSYAPEVGISVDLGRVDTHELVQAMADQSSELVNEEASLVREQIRTLINTHLESILNEAQERLNVSTSKPR
jgi:hypothetical protein